jgi:hypothetical protein
MPSKEAGLREYQQAIESAAVQVLRAPLRYALELEAGFQGSLRGLSLILEQPAGALRVLEEVVES